MQVRCVVVECLHQHQHNIRSRAEERRKKTLSPVIHSTTDKRWNRYESEQEEKIMASSAQPTRLSKLSFPRYTTSLATKAADSTSPLPFTYSMRRKAHTFLTTNGPPARIISSQTRRTLAALPLATTSLLIFSPACASMTAHRVPLSAPIWDRTIVVRTPSVTTYDSPPLL